MGLVPRHLKICLIAVLAVLGAIVIFRWAAHTPSTPPPSPPTAPPGTTRRGAGTYTFEVLNTYPHDSLAFTQGLAIENGILYEGTGLRGHSTLRKVDLKTGQIISTHQLADHLFGEGITLCEDKIIQLTYTSNVGFVYDKTSFELVREFGYPMQGWGITYDGRHLIISDGSSILHFVDPETFRESHRIAVSDDRGAVEGLNELECVEGEIYANVLPTDRIAIISPRTGQVTGWIDLGGLLSREDGRDPGSILNGIAYDVKSDRLFVTGKLWPRIFEIELIPHP
jgi:glutamine cyclotransferase